MNYDIQLSVTCSKVPGVGWWGEGLGTSLHGMLQPIALIRCLTKESDKRTQRKITSTYCTKTISCVDKPGLECSQIAERVIFKSSSLLYLSCLK